MSSNDSKHCLKRNWLRYLLSSQSLMLIRALIPTWRFFDRIGDEAIFYVRTRSLVQDRALECLDLSSLDTAEMSSQVDLAWGSWQEVNNQLNLGKRTRKSSFIFSLFHSPDRVGALALHNLLERALAEIESAKDTSEVINSVTYGLLENWARFHLTNLQTPIGNNKIIAQLKKQNCEFQFSICTRTYKKESADDSLRFGQNIIFSSTEDERLVSNVHYFE